MSSIPSVVEVIPYALQVLVYTHDINHSRPEDCNEPQEYIYDNGAYHGKPLGQFDPFRGVNVSNPCKIYYHFVIKILMYIVFLISEL
jgi:hypothetical protein